MERINCIADDILIQCAQKHMPYDNKEYQDTFHGIDTSVPSIYHLTWFFFNLFLCTFSMSRISSFL